MDRSKLLGLAANLNVVQAELDSAGLEYKEAASHPNGELGRTARFRRGLG